jgi:hypothetical protein
MDLVRIYQDILQSHCLNARGPWNVMQCNVANDIFSRDFEHICFNGFGTNIRRHITGEGPLECDAVYCRT